MSRLIDVPSTWFARIVVGARFWIDEQLERMDPTPEFPDDDREE